MFVHIPQIFSQVFSFSFSFSILKVFSICEKKKSSSATLCVYYMLKQWKTLEKYNVEDGYGFFYFMYINISNRIQQIKKGHAVHVYEYTQKNVSIGKTFNSKLDFFTDYIKRIKLF